MRIHGNGDFLWRTAVVGELYDLKSTTQLIYPPPQESSHGTWTSSQFPAVLPEIGDNQIAIC